MTTTVYVSAGSNRYHRTPDCKALESMQLLNEDMSGEDWVPGAPYAVCHAFLPTTTELASRGGRTPCRLCRPELAVVPDTFGHEPTYSQHFGAVCRRCTKTVTHYDEAYQPSRWVRPIVWPCTSAVVLGLVDREQVSA